MKVKQLFALSALALATGAVMAQAAADAPLTRAEVRQQVLDARANGTLRHAGETAPEEMTPYKAQIAAPATLTKAQEKATVLQARAAGQLAHTGSVAPEEEMEYARAHPSTSTLARGTVKEQVLEARADGTLIPAGEGEYPDLPPVRTHATYAKAGQPTQSMMARGQ
ncbi:MAG TPA: DUF4148 domain-containing protein [Caldimonas sp.]|jgi:hypothetical protein|nr:DUF4148 domain-containing protein [Caldimonas sp.]